MPIDRSCPLCGDDIESTDQVFWEWSITRRVWNIAQQHNWVPMHNVPLDHQCSSHLIMQYRQNTNSKIMTSVAILLWSIWKGRNDMVFQNKPFNPIRLLINAKKAFAEREIRTCMLELGGKSSTFHLKLYCEVECPPRRFVKLNFGGSCVHNSMMGGFIFRDWATNLLKAGACSTLWRFLNPSG